MQPLREDCKSSALGLSSAVKDVTICDDHDRGEETCNSTENAGDERNPAVDFERG